jgi:hypothetical protein
MRFPVSVHSHLGIPIISGLPMGGLFSCKRPNFGVAKEKAMKSNLSITKTGFVAPEGVTDHKLYWAMYIQRGKYRYYHKPTVGTSNIKGRASAMNAKGQTTCNVKDTAIWARKDTTCDRCSGRKVNFHKTQTGVTWGPDVCPRCQGKGYLSVGDEYNWEKWQERKFMEQHAADAAAVAELTATEARLKSEAARDKEMPKMRHTIGQQIEEHMAKQSLTA